MKPMRHRVKARARIKRSPGQMNKAESQYALVLEQMRQHGEIDSWAFEAEKLRLADATFYTPDFRVVWADGRVEFHEVKAFWKSSNKVGWEDDARVKIKVAAEMHPYRFAAVWLHPEFGWSREDIGE